MFVDYCPIGRRCSMHTAMDARQCAKIPDYCIVTASGASRTHAPTESLPHVPDLGVPYPPEAPVTPPGVLRLSRSLQRIGWISFWTQLVLSCVSAVVFFFSTTLQVPMASHHGATCIDHMTSWSAVHQKHEVMAHHAPRCLHHVHATSWLRLQGKGYDHVNSHGVHARVTCTLWGACSQGK